MSPSQPIGSGSPSRISDLASHCIRCGFCLESCPTFVVTGQETESPRGRIYLIRSADEGKLDWRAAQAHLDHCLGCRACETACPSGVEYGSLLEIARQEVRKQGGWDAKRFLLKGMSKPNALRRSLLLSRLLPGKRIPSILSRLLSGQAPTVEKPSSQPLAPWPRLEEAKLPPVIGEVYLLEGCAMRVLYPNVHEATRRLLRRVGFVVRPSPEAQCCGALHAHNGYLDEAKLMATRLSEAFADDLPIIVNSAGCGSWLQDFDIASRGIDASVFLQRNGLADLLRRGPGMRQRVTYHDACHLAHGQGVRAEPRELIQSIPGIAYFELAEADRCCGSAGIYNLLEPQMARTLLERKWGFIERSGAALVALGNPGCHAWIAQAAKEKGAAVRILHTMELLEESFQTD